MTTATWNGATVAESANTIEVEGNQYFPPDAVNREYLRENSLHTVCPWKGRASYCDIVVDGDTNDAAAWYYPDPSPEAERIRDYVAFWHGVEVS